MIRSIKMKMMLLVVGIMASTAVSLIYFTQKDIGREILGAEEKSIQNALYLIRLNIENEYKSLLFHKLSTLAERKTLMKDLTGVVVSGIEGFYGQYKQGVLDESAAREQALAWVSKQKYGKDDFFFVYDEHSTVLAHPDSSWMGRDMSFMKDIKGLDLLPAMLEKARKEGDGYATFSWSDSRTGDVANNLGYFTLSPAWKWMVATAVPVGDIEADARKKSELIIKELKETFAKTKIAQTGFLFLFNGKKEILIPPQLTGASLPDVKNPLSGGLLLDDLTAAAKTPGKLVEYEWKGNGEGASGAPVTYQAYAEYFKTLDWIIVAAARKDEITLPARTVVFRQSMIIGVIFLVSVIITYLLQDRISRHIRKLANYAKALPEQDFGADKPADEPSEVKALAARYRDEVGELAEAFIFMEDALRKYIHDLRETTAAKERIESELQIARDIQMSILPKLFPAFPNRRELDIYAMVQPAREVGGDFYDFFFIDEDHLFFSLGDVSGKGVPASLFMAVTKTLLRASVGKDMRPDRILAHVNNVLCEGNDACMFVTVFCGILNVKTGVVLCANGGHNPSLEVRSGHEVTFLKMPAGVAIGIVEDFQYETREIVLQPGDTLFMYTDGVTEAMNERKELFSEERLHECVCQLRDESIRDMTLGMMERIGVFCQKEPQSDDITMLALRYFNGVAR